MEKKRWHTLTALVCSLSLQAVALAQKPEVRQVLETLVSEGESPKPEPDRSSVKLPDGTKLEAGKIVIQLPNGETRVITLTGPQGAISPESLVPLRAEESDQFVPKYVIGVSLSEVPDALRAHVALPDEVGVMVGSLFPDSPAAQAGLLQYDLLLKSGDRDLKHPKDLQEIVDASEGKPVSLTFLRKGEQKSLDVTPVKREDAKFAMAHHTPLNMNAPGNQSALGNLMYLLPPGYRPGSNGLQPMPPIALPAPIEVPLGNSNQVQVLTDSIRQLTEQVERLKGSIDKLEQNQGKQTTEEKP